MSHDPRRALQCRKQERTFELSEVVQRRRELAEHAEQRSRDEAFKARVAAREKAHEARRKDVAQKRELLLQRNMKQVRVPTRCAVHTSGRFSVVPSCPLPSQ